MSDFFAANLPSYLRCPFVVGRHQSSAGIAPTCVHWLTALRGKELERVFEGVKAARAGKEDDGARDEAVRAALCAVWDRLAYRVDTAPAGDYGGVTLNGTGDLTEVSTLRGEQLKAYFRGEYLPADTTDERRKEIVEEMREHKVRAVDAYWRATTLDESFRI